MTQCEPHAASPLYSYLFEFGVYECTVCKRLFVTDKERNVVIGELGPALAESLEKYARKTIIHVDEILAMRDLTDSTTSPETPGD